jgi:glutamate 5-kinase
MNNLKIDSSLFPLSLRSQLNNLLNLSRIVIKVGTEAITRSSGGIDPMKITAIVSDISYLKRAMPHLQVILVTSGAIQTARGVSDFSNLISTTPSQKLHQMQALSALGQPILMGRYIELFGDYNLKCAQILLTHDDFLHKTRHSNCRNTLEKLLSLNVIPILNENDTISYSEIALGDNDQLAALTTELVGAQLLLILTGPDGLFESDPTILSPKSGSKAPISYVPFDAEFSHIKLFSKSGSGRGGMRTKLLAIRKVTPLGVSVVLSTYKAQEPILRALTTEVGTYFEGSHLPRQNPNLKAKSRYSRIIALLKNDCFVDLDQGAFEAISKGASLLPQGISDVFGKFKKGDVIGLRFKKKLFAAGIVEYDSKIIHKIKGLSAKNWPLILTELSQKSIKVTHRKVVIHRDKLALLNSTPQTLKK